MELSISYRQSLRFTSHLMKSNIYILKFSMHSSANNGPQSTSCQELLHASIAHGLELTAAPELMAAGSSNLDYMQEEDGLSTGITWTICRNNLVCPCS